MNKKVIYTVITGGYDNLIEQPKIEGYDYICFTYNTNLKSDIWQIRDMPEGLSDLTTVKQQRNVKILAHKYLPEYDFSVYIDGNVKIVGDLNDFVKKNCSKRKGYIFIGQHPERDCIYEEAKACMLTGKDKAPLIADQVIEYHKEGFPLHYGLTQTCIVLRYHNNEDCKRLMELWWNEVKEKSHRDQLSLHYCEWKDGNSKITVLDKGIFKGDVFNWGMYHGQRQKTKAKLLAKTTDNIYWMVFPTKGQTPWSTSKYVDLLKDKKTIDVRWLNLKYMDGYDKNENHLYPDNFYKMILPLMSIVTNNFKFNINDFELVEYFTNGNKFNLSYLVPKNKEMKFTFERNGEIISEHEDFSSLHYMDTQWEHTENDLYKSIFRGAYSCCKITNETVDNELKLIVTGDDSIIPAIPILACYYKEVTYLDNRDGGSYKQYFENKVFDEIIVQLNESNTVNKPLIDNLK